MANRSSKSKLSKKTNQRRNTVKGRNRMARSSFASPKGVGDNPKKNQYRMDDLAHARNARSRVRQHGSPSEQRRVFRATARKYPSLKNTATYKKVIKRK